MPSRIFWFLRFGIGFLTAFLLCVRVSAIEIVGETIQRSAKRPGDFIDGSIAIGNKGKSSVEVRIYQTDYCFSADGATRFPAPGSLPRSNAKWLQFDINQISISGETNSTLFFKGIVPAGITNGSYWSMVMVEEIEPISAPLGKVAPEVRRAGVRVVVRHAIQIICDIGQVGAPDFQILAKPAFLGGENREYALDVGNQGDWVSYPEVSMELFDSRGVSIKKALGAKVHLHPGCSYRYRFRLAGVKAGQYTAAIVFDTGDDNLTGAQHAIVLPE